MSNGKKPGIAASECLCEAVSVLLDEVSYNDPNSSVIPAVNIDLSHSTIKRLRS